MSAVFGVSGNARQRRKVVRLWKRKGYAVAPYRSLSTYPIGWCCDSQRGTFRIWWPK